MAADGSQPQDRQSDLAVMGADEYKQKRRLQRILDAHDSVEEKADEAYDLYVSGQISQEGKDIVLLRATQKFIRECFNLLLEFDSELEDEVNEYWAGRVLGEIEMQQQENVSFNGLRDLLYADEIYSETWEEPVSTRHGQDQTQTFSAEHTVPEDVTWKGYLVMKEFLAAEKDLEIKFEELDDSLPTWGYEEADEADIDDEDREVI